MNEIPFDKLTPDELEDLIQDLDLDVTVEDLIEALRIVNNAEDIEELRASIHQISDAA